MIGVIVWKELRETIRDKSLLSSLLSVLMFIVLLSVTSVNKLGIDVEVLVFYMAPCIGVMVGFSLSSRFMKEKLEGVVETLLCTPLSLRSLWLGKVIGLTIPSYTITIASMIVIIVLNRYVLSGIIIIYLFMVVPVVIAAAIGLLGFLYYVLGMRQVQALNYVVFFTLFTVLFIAIRRLAATSSVMSWGTIMTMLAMSSIVLGIITYLVTYLNKERIVTTIS